MERSQYKRLIYESQTVIVMWQDLKSHNMYLDAVQQVRTSLPPIQYYKVLVLYDNKYDEQSSLLGTQ